MESPGEARPVAGVVLEFPALSCSPPTIPPWLRSRLSEPKASSPSTVEDIEAKLRDADLRRQKFYENLSSKARSKVRNPSQSSPHNLGQRLEAKLLAAKEKRLHILRDNRQRRATLNERTTQSLMRRMTRESKYKEQVCAAISQKRADAEKKRLSLLEAEKRRAHARALKVQTVARSVSQQRETVRSELKNKLEDRLQKAKRLRAEYLYQRGRHCDAAVPNSWEIMHEHAGVLTRNLSRCWRNFKNRRKTTAYLSKAYNDLNINERSVKSMPFEQFALLIQSPDTLRTTKALLDRLEIRYELSRSTGNQSSLDDIDHLLKRVASASPKRKQTSRRVVSNRKQNETPSIRQTAKTTPSLSRYQARVVLCAYMILGHPEAVISGQGERETALVNSAKKFVEEFDLLIRILLNGPLKIPDKGSDNVALTRKTFRLQLAAFDSSWCSFLNSFVVWKAKDARSLEDDLVRAACRLELSMIQICKINPKRGSAPLSDDKKAIQKQVSEDQKLLRERVQHLSGDAGIERMENALSDTRTKFFQARKNRGPRTAMNPLVLSPGPASSSSLGSSDEASNLTVAPRQQSSMTRSLFKDEVGAKDVRLSSRNHRTQPRSRESLDMENARIVNEYVHGGHLSFSESFGDADEDQIMGNVKETMEKAFWDGIIESVRQEEPNYSRVTELMVEVRDEICAMSPRTWRQDITETIDPGILSQVLSSGESDISYFGKILDYALNTLQKLSAPADEDELKKKHQQFMKDLAETSWARKSSDYSHAMALIKGLRFVLEQIKELKQEISKAHIRMMEPFLKGPEALNYLGRAFTSHYGHPSNARIALPLTLKWLTSTRESKNEEWNEHKSSVSEMKRSFLPSTTLRTGGRSSVKVVSQADKSSTSNTTTFIETIDPNLECKGEDIDLTVRLGLLKMVSRITGLTEGELPETMNLNFPRLRSVQSQIQKNIVIATSLLVLRQTLTSHRTVGSEAQMDSLLSASVKRLCQCLDSVAEAGVQEIVETLSSCLEEDDNRSVDDMKQIMARMLSKSLQEGDAIFAKVSRAVYLASRGVLFGGTGSLGRKLAEMALQKVGASLLIDDVMQAASVLVVAAKVSVIVHGPWYANLVQE